MKNCFVLTILTSLVYRSLQTCEFIEAKSKVFKIQREYRHYNEDGLWEPRWYEKKTYPTLYFTIYCQNVTFRIGEELEANYKENNDYPLHLEIDKSDIPELPVGVLVKFSSVKTILLNGNGVQSIQPGAFSGLTKLEELYLQDNLISEISRGVLNSLINLRKLDLSNNSLVQIENNAFLGLMKLERLSLKWNRLTQLNSQLFATQRRMKFVDLSGNNIKQLPSNLFYNLTELHTVLLNNTGITDVDKHVFYNASVIQLLMSTNNITVFNVTHIPITVRKLGLENNSISILDWNRLERVLFLDVSNNNISTISNFSGALQYFNVSKNKIQVLNFTMPLELEIVDFSFNFINLLDQTTFVGLRKLNFLSLKHNNITFIPPGTFKGLDSLTSLDISDNHINELEFGIFTGLKNVRTLNIHNNMLTEVPELSFHELTNLQKVDLSNNSLSSFRFDDFVEHLKKLRIVNINNNNFNCDTLFKAIKKFESKKVVVITGHLFNSSNVYGMSCISNGKTQINNTTAVTDTSFSKNLPQLHLLNNSLSKLVEIFKLFSKHSISNSSIVNLIVKKNYEHHDDEVHSEKLQSKVDESNYGVFCVFMIIISLMLFVIMSILLYVLYVMFYKSDRGIYHVRSNKDNNDFTNEMIAL